MNSFYEKNLNTVCLKLWRHVSWPLFTKKLAILIMVTLQWFSWLNEGNTRVGDQLIDRVYSHLRVRIGQGECCSSNYHHLFYFLMSLFSRGYTWCRKNWHFLFDRSNFKPRFVKFGTCKRVDSRISNLQPKLKLFENDCSIKTLKTPN